MTNPILISILKFLLSTISSISKFGKTRLEKQFNTYKILRGWRIEDKRSEFNYCYLETLYLMLNELNKDKDIIKLFAIKAVEDSFRKEMYENNMSVFDLSIVEALHTNPILRPLKTKNIDINFEIREFKKQFKQVVQKTRNPKEIDDSNNIVEILKTVKEDKIKILNASFIKDLEFPSSLMDGNNYKQALNFLEKYRENKWNEINDELKYKVIANIGLCKLNLNDQDEGAKCLIEALQYNANNSKALGFAALGYAILEEVKSAKELAEASISKEIDNSNAWVALLESSKTQEEFLSIKTRIPESLRYNETICYNISQQHKKYGNLVAAENSLREAINYNVNRDPQLLALLGTLLLEAVSDGIIFLTKQLNKENKNKINEGIEYLTEAITKVEKKDLQDYRWWWYINRGIARKFINDYQGSLNDIKKAFELHPNDKMTIKHLAISLAENAQFIEAIMYFEQLKQLDMEDDMVEIAICDCLIELKKIEEAEGRLSVMASKAPTLKNRENVISKLIKLKYQSGKTENAIVIANEELKKNPISIKNHLNFVYIEIHRNNISQAKKSLFDAYNLVNNETDNYILFEFAEIFFQLGEYEKASELYAKFSDGSSYNITNQKLLDSYLNSGKLDKVLEMTMKITDNQGYIVGVIEAQSYVYESIGDLNSAIKVCEECLNSNQKNYVILARLANLYFRKKDRENLLNILYQIEDYSKYDISHQFRFSLINNWAGEIEKSLEIALNARRNDFSNGETHLKFIQLDIQLKLDWPKLLNFEKVEINTTASLKEENDNILEFTILDEKIINAERGEINFDNEITKLLIGKSVGDEIIIEKEFGQSQRLTIQSIIHNYAHAQKESFKLLATKFINTKGFFISNIKENKQNDQDCYKTLKDIIDKNYEIDKQIFEFYHSGNTTIGSIASLKSQNPIDIWSFLINTGKEFKSNAPGIGDEFEKATVCLSQNYTIILDITSLLTLAELDVLESLEKLNFDWRISNSTLDILNNKILELETKNEKEYLSVGKSEGKYTYQSITNEEKDKSLFFLEKIQKWVENNCEILATYNALKINQKEREHFKRLLGESFYDTLLIAQDKNYIVLSDDGIFRSLIFRENGIKGIASASFLFFCFNQKLLNQNQFAQAMVKLFSFGYQGLYINSEILWVGFDEAKFTLNKPFMTMLPMLSGSSGTDGNIIAGVVIDFLYKLYTQFPRSEVQVLICTTVIQYAINSRNRYFVKMLIVFLHKRFFLLPEQKDRIELILFQIIQNKLI
jgi:tetratricopeptide (TPR) repeat protein